MSNNIPDRPPVETYTLATRRRPTLVARVLSWQRYAQELERVSRDAANASHKLLSEYRKQLNETRVRLADVFDEATRLKADNAELRRQLDQLAPKAPPAPAQPDTPGRFVLGDLVQVREDLFSTDAGAYGVVVASHLDGWVHVQFDEGRTEPFLSRSLELVPDDQHPVTRLKDFLADRNVVVEDSDG